MRETDSANKGAKNNLGDKNKEPIIVDMPTRNIFYNKNIYANAYNRRKGENRSQIWSP